MNKTPTTNMRDCPALAGKATRNARVPAGCEAVGLRVKYKNGKPVFYLWQAFVTMRLDTETAYALEKEIREERKRHPRESKAR